MPAYICCLLLAVWLQPSFTNPNGICNDTWWRNLLFINNLWGISGCLGQSWSIGVEFQMYLLSPFIVRLMLVNWQHRRWIKSPHRGLAVCTFLVSCSLLMRAMWIYTDSGDSGQYYPNTQWVYSQVYMRMAPYLMGIGCAFVNAQWRAERVSVQPWVRWPLHVLGGTTWLALSYYGAEPVDSDGPSTQFFLYVFGRALFGLAVAYFVLMMLNNGAKALNYVLCSPIWVPFARLSYTAYLLQTIGMNWSAYAIIPPSELDDQWAAFAKLLAMILITSVLTFSMALLVYLAVEKPLMALRIG